MRVYLRKNKKKIYVGEADFQLPDKIPLVGFVKEGDKYVVPEINRIVAWIKDDKLILNTHEPGYHTLLSNIWWYLERDNKELEKLVWRLK